MAGRRIIEPGAFELQVGASSADIRLRALVGVTGAPRTVGRDWRMESPTFRDVARVHHHANYFWPLPILNRWVRHQFVASRRRDVLRFELLDENDDGRGGHIVSQIPAGTWVELIG